MKTQRIPVAFPDLTGREGEYVGKAIQSSWISSSGEFITRFEKEFASECGTRTSIGVCNGTIALHLALLGLGVRSGDEVIVPSLSFIATANAVRYVGAEPVFADVDPHTWCLSPTEIEAKITRRTRGIVAVHIYGHPADMDVINQIARVHGLWVIEDAAEAHFGRYRGRKVGSLAPISTFSFYGNKIITCGEGGAVAVSDENLEVRMRTLRGQGMDPSRRYFFPITGYNFRISNISCAILCAQLERKDKILARRRSIYQNYLGQLKDIPGIEFQPVAPWAELSPWLFCILVDPSSYGRSRDELMRHLDENGVETRPFFIPLHRLPPFREQSQLRGENLPVTDLLSERGMNLPTFPGLSDKDVEKITALVRDFRKV
ncbi:MAG: DegT/DnrJ/EryC1/StrS family aminotransferase [Bdellovibrionales bacterium]|nr:DegT/DnrJ/EryC1/StrS family aminotransferase [Bdellovibrionales bacterium]